MRPHQSPAVTAAPLFVTYGDISPRRGENLSRPGEAFSSPTHFALELETLRGLPRALPLGELLSGARLRGLARSLQRGCFRRKPALQMPLVSTAPPCENAMPDSPQAARHCAIKIILPLNMARAKRKPFKIVPALPPQRHIICAQRKPHVHQHTSLRQHIIAAGTAAHRASRFWLYSSMET